MHSIFFKIFAGSHLPNLRRLSVGTCWLYFAVVGCGTTLSHPLQESEPEHVFLARENAVLRNYFRRQLANMGVFYNVSGRNNVPLVESLVDRRIDHFLLELQEKLSVLQSHVADMDSSQLAMAKAASSEEHLRPCLSWKTSIDLLIL